MDSLWHAVRNDPWAYFLAAARRRLPRAAAQRVAMHVQALSLGGAGADECEAQLRPLLLGDTELAALLHTAVHNAQGRGDRRACSAGAKGQADDEATLMVKGKRVQWRHCTQSL